MSNKSRYVINTTLPGIFSIRPVFGLGAVFALGLRPRANTGHLSQIPRRILKTPGNIVYILPAAPQNQFNYETSQVITLQFRMFLLLLYVGK